LIHFYKRVVGCEHCPAMGSDDAFCLKWNDFQSNVSRTFSLLRSEQEFFDVSLVSDDQKLAYIYRQLESSNPEACQDLVAVTNNLRGCDRNLLFQKLVGTFKHDPDKVEDFWLVVQEEGFIPSEELKIAIADILESWEDATIPQANQPHQDR